MANVTTTKRTPKVFTLALVKLYSLALTGHSGGKCDVIGPKKHVPMGTKVGKVPNKLHQGHPHDMWTFKKKIRPRGSL